MTAASEAILGHPKIESWIEGRENPEKEREKARAIVKELAADHSPAVVDRVMKLLDFAFSRLYDDFHLSAAFDLKETAKKNSVIFIPNHQSHADYVMFNYLLYKKYGPDLPIHIAGGINLNIFLLGNIFRKSGCFFIRRSFVGRILYRLILEAYLSYLLKKGYPMEFFFEGGRSRTGAILPPKLGLFQLFLDAHRELPEEEKRPLLFVPVSMSHEYIPDVASHAKELAGGAKQWESVRQLPGLFKLFAYRFGTIHIRLGEAVFFRPSAKKESKQITEETAQTCATRVREGVCLTPSSLLALILLDAPCGHLTWIEITDQASKILALCRKFSIPLSENLGEKAWPYALENSCDIMIGNKKMAVHLGGDGPCTYSVKKGRRVEFAYFKNTVFHHFIPAIIASEGYRRILGGEENLEEFFSDKRSRLKEIFPIPSREEFRRSILPLTSLCIGREVSSFEELSPKECRRATLRLEPFCRMGLFIDTGYALGRETLQVLGRINPDGFSQRDYIGKAREMAQAWHFQRGAAFPEESATLPFLKAYMKYFEEKGLVSHGEGGYRIPDPKGLDKLKIDETMGGE